MNFPLWVHVPPHGTVLSEDYANKYVTELVEFLRGKLASFQELQFGGNVFHETNMKYSSVNDLLINFDAATLSSIINQKVVGSLKEIQGVPKRCRNSQ